MDKSNLHESEREIVVVANCWSGKARNLFTMHYTQKGQNYTKAEKVEIGPL